MARHASIKSISVIVTILILMAGLPLMSRGPEARSATQGPGGEDEPFNLYSAPGAAGCVLYESDAGVGCRDSTVEESLTLAAKDSRDLEVISPVRLAGEGGL